MKSQIPNLKSRTISKLQISNVLIGFWSLKCICLPAIVLASLRQAGNLLFGICYFASLSSYTYSQDATFTASVNKNRVAVGEQLEVTFTLSGSTGGKNFRPPAFNDFLVLSGPNQSTNMQIINAAMSYSISYSYILQPREEGKFTVGQASIDYGGKQLQSNAISIEVTKAAQRPKAQEKSTETADIEKQIGDNLFLKVTFDKSRVYQGEQITATYKIYTRVNIVNYTLTKLPALTGFWTQELDVPKQIQLTNEVVDGKQYRVGVLKKIGLFPQRSGTLEIDPMEVNCVVQVQSRRRSNDIFDQFFNDPFFGNVTNVNYSVRNNPMKITVNPLPTTNIPEGFTGAVGKYSMESWLDKRQTKTNEPVTLKVKISGRGNIKLLEAPMITIPPDIEPYDPKITDNISNQGDKISGSRTFEYLLIPRYAGEQKIPSFPFSYFDIETKLYATLKSPDFVINVEKGAELASTPIVGISKEDVKLLGEDIRFIKSGNVSFTRKGDSFIGSLSFYLLFFGPIVGFIGVLFYVRRREKMFGDVTMLRNRKARKIAQRRLVQAKKLLDQKRKVDDSTRREEFYTEVSRALWGYVGDKLSLPPAELSIENVRESLQRRSVTTEAVARLASVIDQCEFARFAPPIDALQMDGMYNEVVELISTVEDQVR